MSLQHVLLVHTHEEDSQLAYFVTALVMAALFEPLKRRIDAFVERRLLQSDDGDGGDPSKTGATEPADYAYPVVPRGALSHTLTGTEKGRSHRGTIVCGRRTCRVRDRGR